MQKQALKDYNERIKAYEEMEINKRKRWVFLENKTDILIFQMEDGKTKIDVRLENETVWMTQKAIAELYQKNGRTINEHIVNIYSEGELEEISTNRKNRIVQSQ